MYERLVKSKLALRGMTMKDLAEAIGEGYSSVHEVIHGKWGKNGYVAHRILKKVSRRLNIPELYQGDES